MMTTPHDADDDDDIKIAELHELAICSNKMNRAQIVLHFVSDEGDNYFALDLDELHHMGARMLATAQTIKEAMASGHTIQERCASGFA